MFTVKEQDKPRALDENVEKETPKERSEDFQIQEKKQRPLEQFWDSLHEWADITTLHGIRFVFDRNSPVFRRSIWFVIMLTFLSYLVWNGQAQVNRYLKYSALTVQTSKLHKKLLFPSITICKSDFIQSDSVTNETERELLEALLQTIPNKTLLLTNYGESSLKKINISNLIFEHVITINNFILDCSWEGVTLNCSEYFETSLSENGVCFTVKKGSLETSVTGEKFGWQIKLWYGQNNLFGAGYDNYAIKVSVHHADEKFTMEASTLIGPGFIYHIPVTTYEYSYLPYPVAAFGTQYCKSIEEGEHYTVSGCYRHCRQEFLLQHCGCVSYFDNLNNNRECNAYDIIECYQPTLTLFMTQMENCHCTIPCHVTNFETKISSMVIPNHVYTALQKDLKTETVETLKENIIILKIFYETKEVKYVEQVLEFTFQDIWASFGGYFGLFAGASVLTFVEVLDVIAVNVYHHFIRMRRVVRD